VCHTKYQGLLHQAALSAVDLERAARSALAQRRHIEEVLVAEFNVSLADIGRALAHFFKVPYEPFRSARVKPVALLRKLRSQYVEASQWMPLAEDQSGLVVLALDPEKIGTSKIVSQVFPKLAVRYRVTTGVEFKHTVDQFFGTAVERDGSSLRDLLAGMDGDDEHAQLVTEAVENELVKLVNKVITDAYRQGVSDIHIEPLPGLGRTGIRFRKDGALVPYIDIPASYRSALVARIKIMCDLDTSERRRPQDGKIKFNKYGPLDIELRVATIPSTGGVEDVVMRILPSGAPIPLDQLGVLPANLVRLRAVIGRPHGLFFVCGPTGSGKTTTLHSLLSDLNTPNTKIWTAEDPVEITQPGLRQVQVNRKTGLDFATVMRAFLRADPDIIMVGEMRDRETASIAIEASLTGHLVFATLHTNSAPESIVRLLDMGMDPLNFADALLGVLAQRLARRLCARCKQAYRPDQAELELLLGAFCSDLLHTAAFSGSRAAPARSAVLTSWRERHGAADGSLTLYRAVGCTDCSEGYSGRIGLHELMIGSAKVKRLLQERSRVAALQAAALEDGMLTLNMDGIEKVLMGATDFKTVRQLCM
jgi:type II secretory ATPase GspE/PulE/Tfp pilus assembly ATPase PilB-like protein